MDYHNKQTQYQVRIEQARQQSRDAVKIILAGMIFLLVFLIIFPPLGLIGGIFILLTGYKKYQTAVQQMKSGVGSEIVRDVISQVFDNVSYSCDRRLEDEVIESVNIPYLEEFDNIYGNDYSSGTYKGLDFEMSDISLTRIEEHTDSDGHTTREEITVFDGLWFICDFNRKLNSTITLSPRPRFSFTRGIQLESPEFNKKFFVSADNEHDVFYVLTPQFMEHILTTAKKADCELYFCFKEDGHVHILINRGNALEIESVMKNADELQQQFTEEIIQITDLIDELKITEAYR